MNVSLTPRRWRFVDRLIKAGRFADAAEAVEAALALLETQDQVKATLASDLPSRGADIEALAFIVLMQATQDMDEDLKAIMAEVKAMTAAKRKLRELIGQVSRDLAANAGRQPGKPRLDLAAGLGSERAYHRAPMPVADPESATGVRVVATDLFPGKVDRVEVLEAIRDDLKGRLDSLSEMSEMESLRLQMVMDRRSKLLSTLSNVLKKVSDTQATLVQNLK